MRWIREQLIDTAQSKGVWVLTGELGTSSGVGGDDGVQPQAGRRRNERGVEDSAGQAVANQANAEGMPEISHKMS